MAHEFESGMFVKEAAWHKLGTVVDTAPSIEEGIKLAGLDWSAELQEIVTVAQAQKAITYASNGYKDETIELKPNINHKAVVRSTDGNVLGVVGPRYHVLNNVDAFTWFEDYIDAGLCKLETAGSLKGGRVVWVLASIARPNESVVDGDEIKKFFLLSNSHDGKQAVRIGQTNIRVVCNNTLSFAHSSRQSSLIRITHSAQMQQNLENMKQIIDEVDMSFKATAEQYQFLAGRSINTDDLRKYVKTLLKIDNVIDEEISTRSKNIMEEIMGNMDRPEQQIPGVSGTWYAAYNSYNAYLCHRSGRNEENRLHNIWFGTGTAKNNAGLDLAVTMAG